MKRAEIMNYINRDMENVVLSVTKEYSCILITGPKQVGKSTTLQQINPSRNRVTLDDLHELNSYQNQN